jgi:hypothetical protein
MMRGHTSYVTEHAVIRDRACGNIRQNAVKGTVEPDRQTGRLTAEPKHGGGVTLWGGRAGKDCGITHAASLTKPYCLQS